jgi:hypothetical protein
MKLKMSKDETAFGFYARLTKLISNWDMLSL